MALHYDVNQTPTTGTEAIVQLVTVLSAANWSVHAYGDSAIRLSGGLPNSLEMGSSSSWVAMKAPVGDHTITFQRGVDNTLWWIGYTFGGLQTDGDGLIVDSPVTASDTKEVFNNGSTTVPGTLFPIDNVSGAFRFNVVADDSSPYNWYACAWNKATGEARTLIFFDGAQVHTNDNARYIAYAEYRSSSPWAGAGDWIAHGAVSPGRSWVAKGLGGQNWTRTIPLMLSCNDGLFGFPRGLSANPFDSNDDLGPIVYITNNSGTIQVKGVGTLFLWCGVPRSTGDTFDIVGETDDRVCVSDIALPWPHGIPAVV